MAGRVIRWDMPLPLVLLSHHPKPHKLQRTLSFCSEWQRKRSKQGSGVAHLKIGQHAKIHTLVLQKVSQDPRTNWDQKNMMFVLCSICMCLCVHARVCACECQRLTLDVLFNLFLLIFGNPH